MIKKTDIELYIDKIPPTPQVIKNILHLLQHGDLVLASMEAQKDLALTAYLKNFVNKPIYGFRYKIENISQIFTALGISSIEQIIYNYMTNLLSPDEWYFFKLNKITFQNLQTELSVNWKKILNYLNIKNRNIENSITLLPACFIVTEAIFKQKKDDIIQLRSVQNIDLNTILKRLTTYNIFDISQQISKKWDMPKIIGQIVKASSGDQKNDNQKIDLLGKWMHLLLFYTLSKKQFIEAELNDFIDFNINYVSPIYDEFATLMDIK